MTYEDKWRVYAPLLRGQERDTLLFETTDYADVERAALKHEGGVCFVFISADEQAAEAQRAESRRLENERLEREAEQRRYERTPQGQREAALRHGSRITRGGGDTPELDEAFAGHAREDDPLVGRW